MPNNYTTLSLPQEIADEIRGFDGATTEQKLKNWAAQYETETYNWTELEIRELVREEIEEYRR